MKMAKALTNPQLAADKAVVDAIKTFVASYNQTKPAGDYGVLTWDRAEKIFVAAVLRKNRRGNTGFRGDVVMGTNP
jgi:hypothetical protein